MGHSHHHHHDHEHGEEEKSLKEKIKILVHHWKEHNESHLKEYQKWQQLVKDEGLIDVEELLKEVCKKVENLTELYNEIEKLVVDE